MTEETNNRITLNLPVPVIGMLLIFWGYSNDLLFIALIFALIVDGLKLLPVRWDLEVPHFLRVADLTSVLFAVVVVYQFIEYAFHGIYGVLSLLPICLMPLVLAQRISTVGLIPLSSLFISLRRQIARGQAQEIWVSCEFIYGLTCILAASSNDLPAHAYFVTAAVLVLLLIYRARARRTSPTSWVLTAAAAIGLAFAIQLGMQNAYRYAEGSLSYWFNQLAWSETNPTKSRTSIGHIGRLKLSDRIQLRVKAPLSIPLPLYLQDASYTEFNLGTWLAPAASAEVVDPLPTTQQWNVGEPDKRGQYRIEITTQHNKDVGVQPLPFGATSVQGEEIIELQRNALGTMLLEAIPGQLRYRVDYTGNKNFHNAADRQAPAASDLLIPKNYRSLITDVSRELPLNGTTDRDKVIAVENFFKTKFKYSLIGRGYYPGKKPLADFLISERFGHCEYFATASVLLLRELGIPTRYAVGYVVDEYSTLEQAFIARARHAHAWAEAYVDGRWVVVDTTPANWFALEQAGHSPWQLVQDYLGWVRYHFDRFRRIDRSRFNEVVIWFLPPMFLFLLWRLRGRIRSTERIGKRGQEPQHQNNDDTILSLISLMHSNGYPLSPGNTVRSFLTEHLPPDVDQLRLQRMLLLDDRQRFTDRHLSQSERTELTAGASYCRQRVLEVLKVGTKTA